MRARERILAALLMPLPTFAQPTPLAPGVRVRVQAPELFRGRAIGSVLDVDGDSARIAIPARGVPPDSGAAVNYYWLKPAENRIEVSRGRSRFAAMRRGAWVGLGAGALTAAALAYHESTKVSRPGDDGADMMIIILPLFVASTTVIGGRHRRALHHRTMASPAMRWRATVIATLVAMMLPEPVEA